MWNLFLQFIDDIKFNRHFRKKAEVNRCCTTACGDAICQQIGCLNQDGYTLRPRIKLLLLRVNKKYEKPNRKLIIEKVEPPKKTATAHGTLVITSAQNVVDINEYKRNK